MQVPEENKDHETAILLAEAIENCDGSVISDLLDQLPRSEALREVLNLSVAQRDAAFNLMPVQLAAELVEESPREMAAVLVEHMTAERCVDVIDELQSNIQADVIGDMDQAQAEIILTEMPATEAADVRRLIEYEDNTAGGLMSADAFTFHRDSTVGMVLSRLASEDENFERYRGQHPYILDKDGCPVGVVSLRSMLTASKSQKLSSIMTQPLTVTTDASLDVVEDIFDKHPFLGLPVVELDGQLAGVLSRTAVAEALADRVNSESMHRQGVFGDELRSMPVSIRSRRRLMWLSANIGLNIIAASVIAAYEDILTAVIAIAIFLPMVSDMSGCSGNQAVGVTMRELSLGLVRPIDAFRVWSKEVSVGLINGIVLGLLIGIVTWLWKGNPWLGVVIGLALAINTLVAVSIGGVVPLLLKRVGQDPAVASGPLLTTITDMAGFFLVLSLATIFMPLLVQ
ncbi:MAG: magnesium transporter [Parasphingorhabdus sp.]|jgi:magnesium transporter